MMKLNKVVVEKFKRNSSKTLRYSAITTICLILLYAVCAVVLTSILQVNLNIMELIIGFLFVFALVYVLQPFIYSYFAMNSILNTSSDPDAGGMASFFETVSVGSKKPINNMLSIFTTLLNSLLVYLLATIVLEFCIFGVLYYTNADYQVILEKIYTLTSQQNSAELSTYVETVSQYLYTPLLFIEFFSSFFAFYYFMHKIGVNLFRYYVYGTALDVPRRYTNNIFKNMIRENHKDFNKNYYSVSWIYILIIVIIYPLSYFLMYYTGIHNNSFVILSMTSMIITVAFVLPFLPLLFNVYEGMFDKYGPMFVQKIQNKMNEELQILKDNYESFSEAEKAQIDQIMKSQKDFENRNKENKINQDDKDDDKKD